MTVPFFCLFLTILFPYVFSSAASYFKSQQLGSIDNKQPRDQAAQLTGAGSRAVAAQANAWEAVAVFTAAVTVNHLRPDADPETSAILAQVFVGARVLHGGFYLADIDKLRSLSFLVALGCAIALFFV